MINKIKSKFILVGKNDMMRVDNIVSYYKYSRKEFFWNKRVTNFIGIYTKDGKRYCDIRSPYKDKILDALEKLCK